MKDAALPIISEVLGDLTLIELDVVDDSVTGGVQTTQHSVICKMLYAATRLEALEYFSERLEMHH